MRLCLQFLDGIDVQKILLREKLGPLVLSDLQGVFLVIRDDPGGKQPLEIFFFLIALAVLVAQTIHKVRIVNLESEGVFTRTCPESVGHLIVDVRSVVMQTAATPSVSFNGNLVHRTEILEIRLVIRGFLFGITVDFPVDVGIDVGLGVELSHIHAFLAYLKRNYRSKSATIARKAASLRTFFRIFMQ